MASWTVVIFSASSSGISVSNSSSRAMTSSTVSSESAPRSSTNEDSVLISASFTPSCSAMIFFTRTSIFSILRSFPLFGAKHSLDAETRILPDSGQVHPAVDVQNRARDIGGGGRREVGDRGGDVLGPSKPAERNLRQQRVLLFLGQRP